MESSHDERTPVPTGRRTRVGSSSAGFFAVGRRTKSRSKSPLEPEASWPRWRGPHQDGQADEAKLPVQWGPESVTWKVDLPGKGQSSPIIWDNQIFLTSYLDQGAKRLVFCVDRQDGHLLWQQEVWQGEPEKSHLMNGWASATCATDGEVVVAFFGRGRFARLHARRQETLVA